MKKCPNCGKEAEDNAIFCSQCGREFDKPKKLTYFERKEAKEQERIDLMNRSYISLEQYEKAEYFDLSYIVLNKFKPMKKAKQNSIFSICFSAILFIGAVVIGEICARRNIDSNLKLIVLLAVFVSCAIALAIAVNEFYMIKQLNNMSKAQFAIKKIKYGQPPYLYYKDNLYLMLAKGECKECKSKYHIEEVDGKFVVVCDANRSHVYKIGTEKLIDEKLKNIQ